MKLFSFIVALMCMTSTAFSDEAEDLYLLDTPQAELIETQPEILPFAHTYFKVGSSILYQNIGFGKRFTDLTKKSGHDWALNIKAPLLLSRKHAFTSVEYNYLFYNLSPEHRDYHSYSGIGLELGALIGKHNKPIPILNPKIVWGKQYTSGYFSQWSLNLLPTALFVGSTCTGIAYPHDRNLCVGLGIISLGTMFEYSVGF